MSAAAAAHASPGPDRADIARWGACFAVIATVHAGLVIFLASNRSPASSGATELPAVVMIDLPPAPAAAEPAQAAVAPSLAETEEAAPEPEAEPVTAEAQPEPVPREPAPPAPPAPAEPIIPPAPLAPKAAVTLPAPHKPQPNPQPKAQPRPKAPVKVADKTPPKPAPMPRRVEPAPRRLPGEPAAAQRTASLPSSSAAGTVSAAASAASAASWRSQLVSYLQGNLRYPPGSRGGGAATVSFTMSRAGRVLSASLAHSAGSPELDAAALDLFRRGTLPAPPADVPGATFSFTIPIRFNAR